MLLLLLKKAFHQQRTLILFCFFLFISFLILALFKGAEPRDLAAQLFGLKMVGLMLLFFFTVLTFFFYIRAVVENIASGNGLKGVEKKFNHTMALYLTPQRLVIGLVGILPLTLTNFSISIGKSLIPALNTYRWDPLMSQWDRILHFGHYPHELLVPWIESLALSGVMNFFYLFWFLVLFLSNGYALFCDENWQRRMRYLWTFVLTWLILGFILATIFASVGPVYFHHFYPQVENPYENLLAHLSAVYKSGVDLNVVRMSPVLLDMAVNDRVLDLNGISAMPSMHVAIAWLIVLYAFSVRRLAGIFAFIFFMIIQIGSVYLSWHYAIDGYVSVILVSLIWWCTGKYINRPAIQKI